jgi:hypothetical protein
MKRIFQLSAAALLLALVACGPTKEQAIDFNDEVVADQKEALTLAENLMSSIYDWDADQASSDLKDFQDGISGMMKKYEEKSEFDKEDEFRKAMISLLKVMEETGEGFEEIVELVVDYPDLSVFTDDELADIEETMDEIFETIDVENKKFLDVQESFAKKYEFTLE